MDTVKGWISNGASDPSTATQAIYAGEENVMHAGVNVVNLTGIALLQCPKDGMSRWPKIRSLGLYLCFWHKK